MNIHRSYNMLLEWSWIHIVGAMETSLHQCLKYIVNEILVIIKVEETLAMIQNMIVPYIEAKNKQR